MKEPTGTPLWRSLVIQYNVFRALLLREILTRYGRHNIGFLWLFVEPMLFTIGVTALWTMTGMRHGSELPITIFALTGYSTVLLWRNMVSRCVGSVAPNAALMYHRNVKFMDIYLSRVALEGIGATMSFVFLSIFFVAIGTSDPPEDILKIVIGWILTAWFGAAAALFLGTLSELSEAFEKLWHPAAYILFPVSGAAFLVDAMPTAFQNTILWLPMVNGTEMIRDGYFGSKFLAHYDVGYFVKFNVILTILAVAIERKVSREYVLE